MAKCSTTKMNLIINISLISLSRLILQFDAYCWCWKLHPSTLCGFSLRLRACLTSITTSCFKIQTISSPVSIFAKHFQAEWKDLWSWILFSSTSERFFLLSSKRDESEWMMNKFNSMCFIKYYPDPHGAIHLSRCFWARNSPPKNTTSANWIHFQFNGFDIV